MARPDELTFAPLGGVGEIGMNLSIYGLGNRNQRSWLAVDLGVSFGEEEHLPGIDLIMPDIRFLEKERKNLVGLVLTHAHEDHFGAIIDLWPKLQCKIYATRFSAALFEAKCASERNAPKIPVTVVPSGGRIDLGPFNVEFIPVAHSIPESHALAIHTSAGTVLHTGDWKIDPTPIIGLPTDERRLRELGDAGVLALVGDSTNAVREGRSPSETEVAATIAKLVKAAKGRVAVTTFASNVARVNAVADAAKAADREVVVVGRGIEVIPDRTQLGHASGHPRRDELRDMISSVRPQILIPVHGEALHLAEHAKLARTAGVPKVLTCRNGDLVKLGPGDPGIIDELPSGRLYKDGNILEDSKSRAVVERRRMGFAGCAFVAIAVTDKGELADDPEVDLVGIPEKNATGEVIDEIVFDTVVSTVENLPRARRRDADATAESVRRAVRAVINEHWGKKPICLVHVLTV